MTTAPLRLAVLGVGRIGSMHAELIAHRVPGAALSVVQDVHGESAASVGARLGVRHTTDLHEAINATDVDAVAICTSTDTHIEVIKAVTSAGKPMFCEKPISQDLRAIDEILAMIERAGLPFHVGFNRRFDPAHRAVREAVLGGVVGDVHLVRITSRDPAPPPISYVKSSGGLFLDMTIHDFDMARYVTGSEVVDVTAHGAVLVDPAIGEAGDVDTAVVVLRHANGAITTIDNSRKAVYGYDQRVEAFGSLGMAQSENPPTHPAKVSTADVVRTPAIPYFFIDRYTHAYVDQWVAFVEAVRTGSPVPINGRDGRAPLVIGLAALRSVAERRTVTIDEIEAEHR